MNNTSTTTWQDLYQQWQWATKNFPELLDQFYCLQIDIFKPLYGPIYYFNWVPKSSEEKSTQKDVAILASGWPEIGANWSKGTLKTAALLTSCKTEEEFAAVWLCAFALSLLRPGNDRSITARNARAIEREACTVFAQKYGYWHSNSRDFFPNFYIPTSLFWDNENLSLSTLVELAAINAALVTAHFTAVEYKKT